MYEDEDGPDDGWIPEMDQPSRFAFCDVYEIHEPHGYKALNGNFYQCSGVSHEDMTYFEEQANAEPCEHGLSAALCGGPMHWYD